MILKYDEGLKKSANPEWFKSVYKREDIAQDEAVDIINGLVRQKGEEYLFSYFEIKEDMILQREYVEDLIDYLSNL